MQFERNSHGNAAVDTVFSIVDCFVFEGLAQEIQSERELVRLGWLLRWRLYSTRSFALAASTVCHCMFEGLSEPPLLRG
jgi:hypothetical protein